MMNRIRYGLAAALTTALLIGGCGKKGPDRDELRMSGIGKLEAGDYSGAVEDLDGAIQASRGRVGAFEIDVLKYRAQAEYLLADYSAASHTYDVLLEVDGRDIHYLYQNAVIKALAGDTEGALSAYDEAVELEKDGKAEKKGKGEASGTGNLGGFSRTEAIRTVGEACVQAGLQDEADRIFQEAIADQAAGPDIYNRMGLNYMEEGQYPEALEAFAQAIQAGAEGDWASIPGMQEALQEARYNQAVVYEYQGDYAKALQVFQSYVAEFGMDDQVKKEIAFLQSR